MIASFKNEFKSLNAEDLKTIINRCAGQDILEYDIAKDISHKLANKYFLKYIEDDNYGYWIVEYGWKKAESMPMAIGTGFFEHQIKITPTRIYFESTNSKSLTPYSKQHYRKQLEDYMFIYINKKCPSYKSVILDETEKFIRFIDGDVTFKKNNEQIK